MLRSTSRRTAAPCPRGVVARATSSSRSSACASSSSSSALRVTRKTNACSSVASGYSSAEIAAHDLLERTIRAFVRRRLTVEKARHAARQLELGEARRTAGAIAHDRRDRERQMREPRQRMSRAQRHRERREQRLDVVAESGGEHRAAAASDTLPSVRRGRRAMPTPAEHSSKHVGLTSGRSSRQRRESRRAARSATSRRPLRSAGSSRAAASRPGHAHHEEFVDVRADDRQKRKPLAQRRRVGSSASESTRS